MNTSSPLIWINLFCLFVGLLAIGQNPTYAQEKKEAEKPIHLEEIAVTATRVEKDIFQTPNAISVADQKQIERMNAQTTPLILRETEGVFVQKTTHGQGSPILRGLTGYQTYIQVDGVRLNNSTFRSGVNQYLATINPESLQRVEVLRGPGSVLYGSSAMGGVISVFTKDASAPGAEEWIIKPHLFGKFASADREKVGRLEVSGGYDQLGFILCGGAKDVEDLRPGRGYDVQLKNRKFYLTSQKPTSIPKDAWLVDIESPIGWREYSGDAKLFFKLSDNQAVKLAYQLARQPDVPRYDKISTKEFEVFSFAPQNRDLAYANYVGKKLTPFLDELRASVSYHRQMEGR